MNDLDLMLLADGEGEPSAADLVGTSAAERAKIEGIREVGHLVRGHLELSADDAEDRLAGLWDLVERRLDAQERADQPVKARPVEAKASLWGRVTGWFGEYRGQVLTGVATAGAVAALFLVLQPTHVITKTVYQQPDPSTQPAIMLAKATPTEIESLDVTGGTGAVFTIAADGDDDGETTVIWVTPDDVLEDL